MSDLIRPTLAVARIVGHGTWELWDENGCLKDRGDFANLITQVGDQYYGERAAGIGGAPGQVTGMRLGTGSTAASKTGAGGPNVVECRSFTADPACL